MVTRLLSPVGREGLRIDQFTCDSGDDGFMKRKHVMAAVLCENSNGIPIWVDNMERVFELNKGSVHQFDVQAA